MNPLCWPPLGVRVLLGLLIVALGASPCLGQKAKRYAVLVGPREYDHSKLTPLDYTQNDVTELAGLLRAAGYEVVLLTDSAGKKDRRLAPTKANIEARMKEVLDKCKRHDLVIVAFSGHGLQFDKDADCYFCPRDGRPFADETRTLISLDGVYKKLSRCGAGAKVLLADCSRKDRARDIDNDVLDRSPPKGVYAFFSCSKGQRAFEYKELKHGVFFHHIIRGFQGEGKGLEDDVTFEALTLYVRRQVPAEVCRLFGTGVKQTPNLKVVEVSRDPLVLLSRLEKVIGADLVAVERSMKVGKGSHEYIKKVGPDRVAYWRRAAEDGVAGGQYLYGQALEVGAGVRKDPDAAVQWYRKAAVQGFAPAQAILGWCYACGIGVPNDAAEAVKWCRKAADQENAAAQYQLGCFYEHGVGVAKDEAEVVKWFRKAADEGFAFAQNSLGLCYERGVGVAKDPAEAVKWYRKAAVQGDAAAQANLGGCYAYGLGVAKDPAEAVKWCRKAADQGHAGGQFGLGWCYETGVGVTKDSMQAIKWYRKAADQGHNGAKEALRRLGK
jgi:TPR repeat protein